MLQEPEVEGPEYQNYSDVGDQPGPELMPEEQDVHADHDGYQRKHVKHDSCPTSHRLIVTIGKLPKPMRWPERKLAGRGRELRRPARAGHDGGVCSAP
jgi:hypothetical protein